jgi:DNA-binding GntR family transcriptional regulator
MSDDGKVALGAAGQYRTIQRIAADYLRSAILTGKLDPGEPINQDRIAEILGVSRMPVREALRVLASEGLVELRPHRQALVTSLDDDDIGQVFGIRALLEARAVQLAVSEVDSATLSDLRRYYTEMGSAMEESDAERWLVLNRDFHLATYARCPWPRLLPLIDAQVNALAPYYRLWSSSIASSTLNKHIPGFHQDHDRILRAIEAGDSEEAALAVAEHVEHACRELLRFLAAQRAEAAAAERPMSDLAVSTAPEGTNVDLR